MKKLFIKLILVCFLTSVIYVLVLLLASTYNATNWLPNSKSTLGGYGQMLLRMQEVKKVKNVDILFVGSSHVYRGFDPRIFKLYGISTFNLGSSSQTPINSYYLLRSQLPKIQAKYIVLDLYWETLQSDGIESSIDIISNSELNSDLIEMSLLTKNLGVFNTTILSAISRLHTPLSESKQIYFRTDHYIDGGFTESSKNRNSVPKRQLDEIKPFTIDLNKVQIEYVKRIIELSSQYDSKIIFVITPVTKEYFSKAINYEEYILELSKLNTLENFYLFDYNNKEDLDLNSSTDFYDKDHLTQTGVEKFNHSFISDLKDYKILFTN